MAGKGTAIRSLPDYEKRVAAARARAEWEIGDASWANVIIEAFLEPDLDAVRLREEKEAL